MLSVLATTPVTKPSATLYRPRECQTTPLHRLLINHFSEYIEQQPTDRKRITRLVEKYLSCGDLHNGFAKIRCDDCGKVNLLAFSCKQRCICPSCHQKRTILTGMHFTENISSDVPHRQVVFTIPKRLRVYPRRDWSLMSAMASEASAVINQAFGEHAGPEETKPGILLSIQTFGTLMNYHPHIHAIVTTGVFGIDGKFREVFRLPEGLLLRIWTERIFRLFLDRGVISEGLADQMRSWNHSGFSVDDTVYIPSGDRKKLQKLVEYIVRAPVSLERILRVSDDGTVIYRSEKNGCHGYPDDKGKDPVPGARRNYEVFTALEFLQQLLQHVPPKHFSLVRYSGWYSSRTRGHRAKMNGGRIDGFNLKRRSDYSRSWALMIARVYQIDPLKCDLCGGQMRVVSFVESQRTIERILRGLGLLEKYPARPPPVAGPMFREVVRELVHVDFETFISELGRN